MLLRRWIIIIFVLLYFIIGIKGECNNNLNVVFLYVGSFYYTNGFITTHEDGRGEAKTYFLKENCNYISTYFDNVSSKSKDVVDVLKKTLKKDWLNIYLFSSNDYMDSIKDIDKNFCKYLNITDCDNKPAYTFLIRSRRNIEDDYNIVTFNTYPITGIGILGCEKVLKDVYPGFVTADIGYDVKLFSFFRDENLLSFDNGVNVAETKSYQNTLYLNAAVQYLNNNTKTNCIISSNMDTIMSTSYTAGRGIYSIGLYYDTRKFISETNSSITDTVLFSVSYNYTDLFINLIREIDNKYPNLDYHNFFAKTTSLTGFSPLLSKDDISSIIEHYNLLQDSVMSIESELHCKVNFDYELSGCELKEFDLSDIVHIQSIDDIKDYAIPLITEYDNPEAIALIVLTSILLLLNVLTIILICINWNSIIFKRSSNLFLLLSLIGVILQGVSIFFWIGKPKTSTCTLRIWLFGIGYSLLYSCILAKNYRLWKIFNSKDFSKQVILDKELILKFVLVIVGIEAILLAIWTGVDIPSLDLIQKGDISSIEHYFICSFNINFTVIFLILKFLLLVPLIFISYITKNIEKRYRETQYIAFSIYNTFIVGIVVSCMIGLINDYLIKYDIISYGILLTASVSYFVMFGPKIMEFYLGEKEDNQVNVNNMRM